MWKDAEYSDKNYHTRLYEQLNYGEKFLNSHYKIVYYLSLFRAESCSASKFSLYLQELLNEIPPCVYTHRLRMCVLRWRIRLNPKDPKIYSEIDSEIERCQQWMGPSNPFILEIY